MDETKVQIGEEVLLDIGIHSEWYISSIGYDGESVDVALRRKADRNKKWWVADTPQTECYVSDLCKHYGDKQICGRCRNRNLFCEAESQPRCPKCGKRGYIRSLESMGVKLKVFDEYRWKCTNCNKYFKEEPKDKPQTDLPEEEFVEGMKNLKMEVKQTDCGWK